MIDIYTKVPGDVNYSDDFLDVDDPLQIHIQQILMVLNTDENSVLADSSMGFNLQDLIFEQNLTESQIESSIIKQINNYCAYSSEYSTSSKVKFFSGPTQDYCLIDIIVDNEKYIGLLVS